MTELSDRAQLELPKILKIARAFPKLRAMGPHAPWQVSVVLVGAPKMKKLNHQYRGKDRPTDVLSFQSPEVFRCQGQLGELVICTSVLKKQALELRHSPKTELRVLMVHGLLHLLGMDHELGPREARQMALYEKKILARLGSKTLAKGLISR
jgi:probable rRNA maturation factor